LQVWAVVSAVEPDSVSEQRQQELKQVLIFVELLGQPWELEGL
jgi:hypothetical protein